eukprot:1433296-Prymnesium_polylepis.1
MRLASSPWCSAARSSRPEAKRHGMASVAAASRLRPRHRCRRRHRHCLRLAVASLRSCPRGTSPPAA